MKWQGQANLADVFRVSGYSGDSAILFMLIIIRWVSVHFSSLVIILDTMTWIWVDENRKSVCACVYLSI